MAGKYFNPGSTLDVNNTDTSDETDINDVVDAIYNAFTLVESDYNTLAPVVTAGTTVSDKGGVSATDVTLNGTDYEVTLVNDAAATVATISTDGTLAGDSDLDVPTEKAVKTYADAVTAASTAAITSAYQAADALLLPLAGGTMSGAIAMGTNKITGAGDPTANQDVATKAYVDARIVQPPASVSVVGGIAGMNLSNDTEADNDVNITAGSCTDSTGLYQILASSEMTKQIDAAWVAGDDAGGMLTGTVAANKIYHVYALREDADGSADYGFLLDGLSITAYLPTGYSHYRWIGYVITDSSSDIYPFIMNDDIIVWKGRVVAASGINTATLTSTSLSTVIPAGRVKNLFISFYDSSGSIEVAVSTSGSVQDIVLRSHNSATQFASSSTVESSAVYGVTGLLPIEPSSSSIYVDTSSTAMSLLIKYVTIKR